MASAKMASDTTAKGPERNLWDWTVLDRMRADLQAILAQTVAQEKCNKAIKHRAGLAESLAKIRRQTLIGRIGEARILENMARQVWADAGAHNTWNGQTKTTPPPLRTLSHNIHVPRPTFDSTVRALTAAEARRHPSGFMKELLRPPPWEQERSKLQDDIMLAKSRFADMQAMGLYWKSIAGFYKIQSDVNQKSVEQWETWAAFWNHELEIGKMSARQEEMKHEEAREKAKKSKEERLEHERQEKILQQREEHARRTEKEEADRIQRELEETMRQEEEADKAREESERQRRREKFQQDEAARRAAEEANRERMKSESIRQEEQRARERLSRGQSWLEKQRKSEETRIRDAWSSYETRWQVLSDVGPVTFGLVPWPLLFEPRTPIQITEEAVREFLWSEAHSFGITRKQRVRTALLRWHPDKFERWMKNFDDQEEVKVREGVNSVSRILKRMLEDA